MAFNVLDDFLVGDLSQLLSRGRAGEARGAGVEVGELDGETGGSVFRWLTRFDDSHLLYAFTLGERRYWFGWESPFDEAHREAGEAYWYDAIRAGTRLEVRYQGSEPTRHLARFGGREFRGSFLQIRSTVRDALITALPTADYGTLTALVDRIRAVEHEDLTFLLYRVLLGNLAGMTRSGLGEQIAALKPRYSQPINSTDPHDGVCFRLRWLVRTLLQARFDDSRRIAEACIEAMALLTANTYASHYSLGLAMDLMQVFDERAATADLVADFATFALVLTPADPHYDDGRARLVELLRAARR